MKKLKVEQIIKDQNYRKQQVIYMIFFITAMLFWVIVLSLCDGTSFNSVFSIIIVTVFVLIPFGYFLGLRKVIIVAVKIGKIKNYRFVIRERKVIDKMRVHADSSNRYCQLMFDGDEDIWVSRKTDRKINVGDVCYLFYLQGEQRPCALYGKKMVTLSTELEKKVIN